MNVLLQQLVFLIKFIQELHKESLKNGYIIIIRLQGRSQKRNNITLTKYVWDVKLKLDVTPTLKWHILKSVAQYSNITKKCKLCLQEKFKTLSYPNPDELLNKRSGLVSKCCHVNNFLLANYKAND